MKKIITLALFGLLQQSHAQGLLTNLEACYPMDCNELNYAPTGAPMNGTANDVLCTSGHTGAASTAFTFKGNSSSNFRVPGNAQTKSTTDVTVAGWYYPTSAASTQYLVFTQAASCTSNWEAYYLALLPSGGNVIFRAGKSDNTLSPCNSFVVSSTALPINNWYYVVMHVNGTVIDISINAGAPITLTHNSPMNYASGTDVFLAGSNTSPNYFPYSGKIDNVRFYNRALTSSEVSQLYADTVSCTSSGTNTPQPPSSCCLGNYCGSTLNPLTGHYEVPMNNSSFNFTTPKGTKSQVLIGFPNCLNTIARLDVSDDNNGIGIKGYSTTKTQNNIGVYGIAFDPSPNDATRASIGVLGEMNKVQRNRGAGVAGFCGVAVPGVLPLGQDVGVYGNSITNGGRWAGYFDGDVNFNGTVYGSQYAWTSDKRFKTNIKDIENVSDKLKKVKGYTYFFNTTDFKQRNFPENQQIGFIAQELKEVFPQLVTEDKQGYLAVNYVGLIPVLLEGFKEQQKQIDELKALVQSQAVNTTNTAATSVAVTLSDKNVVVLNQNVPNPFAESTVISYNIPEGFGRAQIIFSTTGGTVIKAVDIKEKGAGTLNIFANDLSHGLYSYSLIIDGKTVDTKKMIKE